MRIPQEQRPAPYLNRRDQYRMLAMVGLLCLVMVAIQLASQPESWHWLLPPGDGSAIEGDPEDAVALKELDFRVKSAAREPLPPDVFRAVTTENGPPDSTSPGDEQPDVSGVATVTRDDTQGDSISAADNDATSEGVVTLDESLGDIEDNTLGVRRAERDVYFDLLDRVRRATEEELTAQADRDVTFTVVMLQPDDYRGRLIELTGWLRRVSETPVSENALGIERLYEGWMFTEDSGNNPWQIICSSLPPGIAVAETMEPVKVRVIGYFFKRTGYASQGGQHVAPTLLASAFQIVPTPVGAPQEMQSQMRNWLLGFLGLVIVGLAAMIWRFVVADRKFDKSRLKQLTGVRLDAAPEDLAALQDVAVIDPNRPFDGDSTTESAESSPVERPAP